MGVNSVIDAFVIPINMTAESLDRLSRGDIPDMSVEEYRGDFNRINRNLNMLIDATAAVTKIAENVAQGESVKDLGERSPIDKMMKALRSMTNELNGVLAETRRILHAVEQGDLNVRGNPAVFKGGWRDLVVGINDLVDALNKLFAEQAQTEQALKRPMTSSRQKS